MNMLPSECPVCHDDLIVTRLMCRSCGTQIRGKFDLDRLSLLLSEQRHFVEVFLLCEGKLNCVQDELGISYPTVRSRLDEVIAALSQPLALDVFIPGDSGSRNSENRQDILDRLASGDLTADQALELLDGLT
jgi:hypothetical protein